MANDRGSRKAQRGAAMVETAITISVFLLLMFAVIEFALAMFTWTRGVEATRAALRLAIVANPLTDMCALASQCADNPGAESVESCSDVTCGAIFDRAQAMLPQLQSSQLSVRYACSDVGFGDRPEELFIPEVTVEISGFQYEMIVPSLIGLPQRWTLPAMTTTRTGEDLHTAGEPVDACT